ncbi:MAG TPA: hypothetical protein VGB30_04870 [bacterium]
MTAYNSGFRITFIDPDLYGLICASMLTSDGAEVNIIYENSDAANFRAEFPYGGTYFPEYTDGLFELADIGSVSWRRMSEVEIFTKSAWHAFSTSDGPGGLKLKLLGLTGNSAVREWINELLAKSRDTNQDELGNALPSTVAIEESVLSNLRSMGDNSTLGKILDVISVLTSGCSASQTGAENFHHIIAGLVKGWNLLSNAGEIEDELKSRLTGDGVRWIEGSPVNQVSGEKSICTCRLEDGKVVNSETVVIPENGRFVIPAEKARSGSLYWKVWQSVDVHGEETSAKIIVSHDSRPYMNDNFIVAGMNGDTPIRISVPVENRYIENRTGERQAYIPGKIRENLAKAGLEFDGALDLGPSHAAEKIVLPANVRAINSITEPRWGETVHGRLSEIFHLRTSILEQFSRT